MRYDVMSTLQGKQTLAAWKARQLLGRPHPSDEALRQKLIEERLAG